MTMSVGLGRIIYDPTASVLTRKALGTLSTPGLLVTDEAITIDNNGRIALKINPYSGLAQDADGLSLGAGSPIGTPVTGYVGIQINIQLPDSTTPTNAWSFYAEDPTVGLGSSIGNYYAYYADDVARGTNSNVGVYIANMTNATSLNTGVWVADLAGGTELNIGFRGEVSIGADKWNVYMDGTASNYFSGKVGVGDSTVPAKLSVLSTTEQLRLQYSASKYVSVTVDSLGNTSIEAVGTNANIDLVTSGTGNVTINGLSVPKVITASYGLNVLLNGTVQEFAIPGVATGDAVVVSSLLGPSVSILSWCARAVANSCIVRFNTKNTGGTDLRTWYVKAIRT